MEDAGAEPAHDRETLRQRERTSRERRLVKIEDMKRQIHALECTVSAMRIVHDDDSIWDEFLDEDAKRMRARLRRTMQLRGETQQLEMEARLRQRLRHDHRVAMAAIHRILEGAMVDDWHARVKQWRTTTRQHFEPLTVEQCVTVIDASIAEMHTFMGSRDRQSTGVSFLGWRDWRRIDPTTHTLQFSFHKTFAGFNLQHHIDVFWGVYSDLAMYKSVLFAGRAHAWLEILQRVTPTIFVVRYAEQPDDMPVAAHLLYLLSRVETERGFTQCLRSIDAPGMQQATETPTNLWASNCFWFRWEILDGGPFDDMTKTDYRVTIGGSLAGGDANYAARWLVESLASAVRSEQLATGRRLLA